MSREATQEMQRNARDSIRRQVREAEWLLITGASSGIGKAYMIECVRHGVDCIAVAEDAFELHAACREAEAEGAATVFPVVVDLARPDFIDLLRAAVGDRVVAGVINNAGFGMKGAFADSDPHRLADLVLVNALAPMRIAREFLPGMQERRRGILIHVASINALTPIPYNAVYTATKAFLYSYAAALEYENRDSGVVFQLCLPGTTATPFHVKQNATPRSDAMRPEEVALGSLAALGRQAIFIASPRDRILAGVFKFLPLQVRLGLALRILRRQLGMPHVPTRRNRALP